jgi:pimeloyl-ACP methyl ester carboxylesterase
MELAYDRRGSGEPLVLIHALGADRHVWRPVLDLLAAERDVIAVDLPGFGDSPPLANGDAPTARTLAQVVARFARDLGIDRPHVAGNSLGGWVALELALAGDARTVAAIAPAGLWPRPLGARPSTGRSVAQALAPALPVLLASDRARALALASTVAYPARVPRDEAVRLVRSYAEAPGYAAANEAMRAGRFTDLERIRVPVTLAWPDRDRLVGRPARLPAGVCSVTLSDCGHMPMWDDPEQVARFLAGASSA